MHYYLRRMLVVASLGSLELWEGRVQLGYFTLEKV